MRTPHSRPSEPGREPGTPAGDVVAWHDVECGGFGADLGAWLTLAERGGGSVLELGTGTGRVALELASHGFEVRAIEINTDLAETAGRRATERGRTVTVVAADALGARAGNAEGAHGDSGRYGLIAAPMQFVQTIAPRDRPRLLDRISAGLAPGGIAGLAIVEPSQLGGGGSVAEDDSPAPPDIREIGGWVYSSRPLWLSVDGETMTVTRERERVDPAGAIERSVSRDVLHSLDADQLEAEAGTAGLLPIGRLPVTTDAGEADSVIVCFARGPA